LRHPWRKKHRGANMSERFLRKQLFHVGMFYQLDVFNPIYLDKTGEIISRTEGLLKDWNGNLNGFQFLSEKDNFAGKFTMDQFWYHDQKQGDFKSEMINSFSKFIVEINEVAIDTYKPKYYRRIGYRLQFIAKKTSEGSKNRYSKFYDGHFTELNKYGKFDTTSIGFDILSDPVKVKVNLNFATKQTSIDTNAPEQGLLFDLDYYRLLEKKEAEDFIGINNRLLAYVSESYIPIICGLAKEMGMIDE
jgi:hypothetical protein